MSRPKTNQVELARSSGGETPPKAKPNAKSAAGSMAACLEEDPAIQAAKQLFHTQQKLTRTIEQSIAPSGLSLSQFEALAKLSKSPGMIQQDLAEILLLTKGNIGAMINRLARLGYVRRQADAGDKRLNHLHLTAAGSALVADLLGQHARRVREMMKPLTVAQMRQLRNLLRLIEPQN